MRKAFLMLGAALVLCTSPAAFAQDAMMMKGSAQTTPVITKGDKLINDFGGKEGLTALMEDFMTQLLADSRTRPFFESADQTKIKALLVEQFCVIMNGPCTYTGRSMAEAHAGMGVNTEAFYALVEDLQIVMNRRKIPFTSQNKLLAALAPQHRDIITK